MKDKKILFMLTAAIMITVMALSACGAEKKTEEGASGQTEEAEEQQAGMPNPWSDVKTAEEAGEGANVGSFNIEGIKTTLGEIGKDESSGPITYRCMKGIAEAQFPIAAVDMTIRKGDSGQVDFGDSDVSGDYTDYKYQWTMSVDGMEVTCYGNRKKASTKTVWSDGKYSYSVLATGAGGDENYGLPAEDVNALVRGITGE